MIYGSFFGFKLPFALIDTSTDVITILVISVVIGFVTVMTGLFFSVLSYEAMRQLIIRVLPGC